IPLEFDDHNAVLLSNLIVILFVGSRQIQELLTILAKKKLLKASYLHSLLHCGMTSLDLSPCNYLNCFRFCDTNDHQKMSDSVVQMITRRC
ncbi:hypothetical protein QZH41_014786, partial [Actinostola sp. cb2023]